MPLSRFLIEASREGCDLATAEGRAHMAANARPLWKLMPEGALKRQVLAEIADAGAAGGRELASLGRAAPGRAAPRRRRRGGPGSARDGSRRRAQP